MTQGKQNLKIKSHKWVPIYYSKPKTSSFFQNASGTEIFDFRISSYSLLRNYFFWICKLEKIQISIFNFLPNKQNFCSGNYSRAETIWGNTVWTLVHCKCLQGFTGKVHSMLVKVIGKHYTEANYNTITGKIFKGYG